MAAVAALAGGGAYLLGSNGQPTVLAARDNAPPSETGSIVPLPVQKTSAGGWPSLPELPSFSALNPFADDSRTLTGRARVISGDRLVLAGETLKLDGIEAPEVGQTCARPGARRWRCGVAAEQALEHLVRRARVTCETGSKTLGGHTLARCTVGGKDVAEALVLSGHVFAMEGFFAPYAAQEADARARKAGIWRGSPERPSAFRQERWMHAAKSSPGGCPIKGRDDNRRGKVYLVPWSVSYERFNVRERNGDRWFCSEEEAIEAGWKPFERS